MLGTRLSFLIVAVVVLAVLFGLAALSRPDPSRRNIEVFTEMAYSKAYETLTANPNFADGRTTQDLVPGVVPRGASFFPYGAGAAEARRAGDALTDPLGPDSAALRAEGAELYRIYCALCHDARGGGAGPVVLRGMLPPPSLHGDRALGMADGEIFHVLTRGQGNMAAYAAQLDTHERWQVIRHVRRLQAEGP